MSIDQEQIRELTETVWSTVLSMPLVSSPSATALGGPTVTSCVQITGAWEGAVAIRCTAGFARRAAGVMFDTTAEDATAEDVRDALGELANIVGGNLKGILPGPSLLSLPTVAEGTDYHLTVPGGAVVCDIWFDCEGEPLAVEIVTRDAARTRGGAAQ
jgi:chemotaxis protein CheX